MYGGSLIERSERKWAVGTWPLFQEHHFSGTTRKVKSRLKIRAPDNEESAGNCPTWTSLAKGRTAQLWKAGGAKALATFQRFHNNRITTRGQLCTMGYSIVYLWWCNACVRCFATGYRRTGPRLKKRRKQRNFRVLNPRNTFDGLKWLKAVASMIWLRYIRIRYFE